MNLYSIIYQLVCDNDCVIVPGFGGFVTNSFPAKIDFSKQEFYPPSRKVAFNENLSLSDGLLVNYISQNENMSWADAEMEVKSFVADLNAKLADGKSLVFEGLGEFSRRTGTLVFVPDANNLLEESFGLASFNFPVLPSESKPRIESAIIKGTPDKNGRKRGKGRAIAWSLSAAAVVAGLVCLSLYMGWFDSLFGNGDGETLFAGFGFGGNKEQVTENKTEETVVESTADFVEEQEVIVENETLSDEVADENIETVGDEVLAENVEMDEVVAEPVTEPQVVAAEQNADIKVHIIAGCFANYSNAENVYNDLVSKGLSPQILPQQKGLYKVSVKGFATTADACAELQGLKELTGNDLLWVMKL
ncbi:MAG: SPOR domain-containing protein [Bacteroidales bacterium]|nr:SPOR domain-containing protein [Bacteroidales bacterium]